MILARVLEVQTFAHWARNFQFAPQIWPNTCQTKVLGVNFTNLIESKVVGYDFNKIDLIVVVCGAKISTLVSLRWIRAKVLRTLDENRCLCRRTLHTRTSRT